MPSKKLDIKPLVFDTYLAMIEQSVGTKMFQNLPALVNGKKKNIVVKGRIACAFYVSSILLIFKLIKNLHATVDGTVIDLKKSGWEKISKPKRGCIIVWDKDNFEQNEPHKHIGFYLGNNQAISNSSKKRYPVKHHWTYNKKRKVMLLLGHQKLK